MFLNLFYYNSSLACQPCIAWPSTLQGLEFFKVGSYVGPVELRAIELG